jgi:serine/threonine protein phosphatase PrpC
MLAGMSSEQQLAVCGATDIGLSRTQNEDTFVIADLRSGEITSPCVRTDVSVPRDGLLLMVCDGMGGRAAGEVASQLTAESMKRNLVGDGQTVQHPAESLKHAIVDANQAVRAEAAANPSERGMGTTCTAAIVLPDRLVVGQVGDSRAYLLHDGKMQALTSDQSIAGQMAEQGLIGREQVENHPLRHVLIQAVGGAATIKPVISQGALSAGDRILICSDGLHACVPEERIAAILRDTPDLQAVTKSLIQAALAAGGPDNVTVIVAER